MNAKEEKLPDPVRKRLPKYLIMVREFRDQDHDWVSSVDIAKALNLTSSTVRQDLSHFELKGVSKRGYEICKLEEVLVNSLGGDRVQKMIIVGAGYLGTALARLKTLRKQQFDVVAIFDTNTEIQGTKVGDASIRPMSALPTVVRDHGVEIGVVAVPASAAQQVADQLVGAGIKGILNLAYIQLRVPQSVPVQDARLVADLQELSFMIRQAEEKRPAAIIV